MLLAPTLTVAFPALMFLGVLLMIALSYAHDLRRGAGRGMTTEVAVLVTFVLGALSTSDTIVAPVERRALVVAAVAVLVAFLLSSKPRILDFIGHVSEDDVYSTLKFLVLAVLVLPLLPDDPVGPFGALRPFHVGLMVVLIASISFAGYLASRLLGPGRGLVVTAVVGGLVSSTAVTLAFAGRAKKDPAVATSAAAAIVLASTIMFGRVLIEVAVVYAALLPTLAIPVVAMASAGIVVGLYFNRASRGQAPVSSPVPLTNPFELSTAIYFGLLFAAVLIVSRAAQVYAGNAGIYAAAALAGTTDVDAITLSTAGMARDGLDRGVAAITILIAAAANTLVKATLATVLGGWALGRRVAVMAAAMLGAGAVAMTVVHLAGG